VTYSFGCVMSIFVLAHQKKNCFLILEVLASCSFVSPIVCELCEGNTGLVQGVLNLQL
jgi:hypothetical protein